jgi:hypothetical protein
MVTVMGGRTYTVNGVTRPFDAVTCFQAAPGISVMALRLFGELGAELSYDWTTGVIVMTFGQTTVTLAERSALMKISGPRGEREVILRTAVVNRNGRAYIPTRDVSEYLGFTVDWQAADNSISILVKPAEHQIGARTVEGQAEFYDRVSGQKFTPWGANYIRLTLHEAPHRNAGTVYHATFDPGLYSHHEAEIALGQMKVRGYNTVRVFIDQYDVTTTDGKLCDEYMNNLTDFLLLAKANGIYAILTTDELPWYGYGERITWSAIFTCPNHYLLMKEAVQIECEYWQDLIRALIDRGASTDQILGYAIRNEAFYLGSVEPFTLTNTVTTGNGRTYNLSKPTERQMMMDDNLVYWFDQVRSAILKVDPSALVGCGFFEPQEPNPSRPGDARIARSQAILRDSSADFVDFHAYPGINLTLGQYAENFAIDNGSSKPLLMGEAGAFQWAWPTPVLAAEGLRVWREESVSYGFDGWLLWTWDTKTQDLWNAMDENGAIADAFAPPHGD